MYLVSGTWVHGTCTVSGTVSGTGLHVLVPGRVLHVRTTCTYYTLTHMYMKLHIGTLVQYMYMYKMLFFYIRSFNKINIQEMYVQVHVYVYSTCTVRLCTQLYYM